MAITPWIVVSPQANSQVGVSGLRKWQGAATGAGIEDSNVKDATLFIVEAESEQEAWNGVHQLYGGNVAEKLILVKKSNVEEK